MAELRRRRDEITTADLVELRLDTVADPSAAGALAGRRRPVIVTCRPAWEGGWFRGSEEERHRLLSEAQQRGAEYVDVEWAAQFHDIIAARGGQGVIVSRHDFTGMPPDLADQVRAMRATGAEIVKVAVTTRRLSDCVALLGLAATIPAPKVVIGMGETGLATRVLASRFHSCWTYAGTDSASGQPSLSQLLADLAFRSVGERTALYAVVGRPVMHSLSPAIHNAAFRAARLDAVYLPLAAADFDDFLAFADAFGLMGASVTAPFKIAAFERAEGSDAVTRRIGAVNTLRRHGSGWAGCNTDVGGFLAPLQQRMPLRDRRATILGAGGAARAVAEALHSAGAHVSVAARRRDAAQAVAQLVGGNAAGWPPTPGSWDVLVNATPVGMTPDICDSPLPGGPFTGALVYDLVYDPPETRLLQEARAAGCATIGGLEMLLAQAQQQFEWWTGLKAPERAMREAAHAALARRRPPALAAGRDRSTLP